MSVQDYINEAREELANSEVYPGTMSELNHVRSAIVAALNAMEELAAQVNALSDRNPPV